MIFIINLYHFSLSSKNIHIKALRVFATYSNLLISISRQSDGVKSLQQTNWYIIHISNLDFYLTGFIVWNNKGLRRCEFQFDLD